MGALAFACGLRAAGPMPADVIRIIRRNEPSNYTWIRYPSGCEAITEYLAAGVLGAADLRAVMIGSFRCGPN